MVMDEAGALRAIPGRLESRRRLNSSGGGGGGWLGTKGRLAAGEPARPCAAPLSTGLHHSLGKCRALPYPPTQPGLDWSLPPAHLSQRSLLPVAREPESTPDSDALVVQTTTTTTPLWPQQGAASLVIRPLAPGPASS